MDCKPPPTPYAAGENAPASGKNRVWDLLSGGRPPILSLVFFYIAYVLAGGFGQGLAIIPGVSITFWPPAGIFVAMLLLHDKPSWPWWIAAACLAELTCNAIWFHNPIPFALIYFAANALEAFAAAWLIGRFVGKPFRLETLEEVAAFVALGAIIAPMVGATVIATTDALLGKHPFWTAWPLVWLGDGTGLLVSTPLALVAVQSWRERMEISRARLIEAVILLVVLAAIGALSFSGHLPTAFMTMPPLLWAAARFQLKGAAVALALIALMEALFTVSGRGVFAGDPAAVKENVILLQTFFGISAVSALVVAALSLLHQKALHNEQTAKAELELRVAERTADLRDSQARLQSAIEIAGLSPYSWDPATGALQWDARLKAMFGLPADADVDYDTWKNAVHPEDRKRALASVAHSLDPDGNGVFEAEYRAIGVTDGVERWVAARGRTFFADGKPAGFVGTARDITKRKQAEQALADLAATLTRERERLNIALKTGELGVYEWRIGQSSVWWSPETYLVFGVDRKTFSPTVDSFSDLIHPDDRDELWRKSDEAIARGDVFIHEYRIIRPDGELRWLANRSHVGFNAAGQAEHITGIVADITERVLATAALRDSEERLRFVLEAANIGAWRTDLASGEMICSPECRQIFGVGEGEAFSRYDQVRERIHPDDREPQSAAVAAAIESNTDYNAEYRVVWPDGSLHWVMARGRMLPATDSAKPVMAGVVIDITERKQAEERLRASEELLRLFIEHAPAAIAMFDRDMRYLAASRRWRADYKLSGDFIGRSQYELYPEIGPAWKAVHQRCLAGSIESSDGEAFARADGSVQWVKWEVRPWHDETGAIAGLLISAEDVTAAREAEEGLRDRERILSLASEAAKFGVHEFDVAARQAKWSAGLWRLVGLEGNGDVPFETMANTIHPDDRSRILAEMDVIMRRPGPYDMEFRIKRPDDTELWALDRGEAIGPVDGATGLVSLVRGTVLDITDRKQAEEAVQASEAFSRSVLEASPDCVKVIEPNGKLEFMNDNGMRQMEIDDFGFCRGEMWSSLWPEETRQTIAQSVAAAKEGMGSRFEAFCPTAKGTPKWWDVAVSPVLDAQQRCTRIVSVSRDITDRKRHEDHLKLMMKELNHRVKNTLATIQSMAAQTLRNSTNLTEAKERLEARLIALSKAHDVLTREKWESAPLIDVVERAIAPYRSAGPERFTIEGPALRVPPRFALAMALALHELGTNAVKYGALSNDRGKVSFTWGVAGSKTQPKLKMRWVEKGGPKVEPPSRKGFGSRLIERGLASDLGGEVKLAFARSGVTCAIVAPLDRSGGNLNRLGGN